ncbi:DNA ligase [Vibrio sp. SM6]|uniref:DNA ligase n=1 Tax=Vibrio agarilyticus TaxID=2726741 RepID=A0A7X8YI76_9VIBR|nr:zinc ribbon domain-containing protein [Vibrio agarilyticus]NLS14291.1 DNA ligase [Vibrio agarilyticus]
MSENTCPKCLNPLVWQAHYHCLPCNIEYQKRALCPDCGSEMEKLQACGAANYFCPRCNELKSKSRIRFDFIPID